MTVLLAGAAALGLLLVYDGLTDPSQRPRRQLFRKLDDRIAEAGVLNLNAGRLLAGSVLSWLTTFILVAGLTTSPVVASVLALGAAAAPFTYVASRRKKRLRRLREGWPDALAALIAGVRAGISLPEACASLGERAPSALRPGFLAFSATYRATGSFDASLARLTLKFADPTADRVAASLSLANQVGGTELVRLLRALSDFVRDELRVRKEVEARWSWTVTAARVAAAAPWLVLLMMALRPEAAAAYNSASGATVVFTGAVATFVGYRLMLRAARLPEERRLGR